MKKVFTFLFLLVLLPYAYAAPELWNVDEGTAFNDGTTLSGSFRYDSDTDTYSDVNLSTEPGWMVSCSDVGNPDDFVCDAFDFATNVDGYLFDNGVTASGTNANGSAIAEPNLFGFSSADAADGLIDRALFLNFLGVELVGGTVQMTFTEWFCVQGDCAFFIESQVFRFGNSGSVSVPEPGTFALLGVGL
ncbi:MAG: PEP-CTERM sorting domain-containing protein, partial [Gammaproteobacteria bacterium]|nr:PEP-CTERM sorting domain-containing protein [Gammaproteobacteria bacterium]